MGKAKTTAPAAGTPTEGDQSEAPSGQKIVMLRSHPRYAYNAGDRAELADEHADLLIDGGFARPDVDADETTDADSDADETR